MAKAKKSEGAAAKKSESAKASPTAASKAAAKAKPGGASKSAAAKAAAPKAASSKAAAPKAGRGGGTGAMHPPMIDTGLAAQAAAKMLVAGFQSKNTSAGAGAGTSGAGAARPQSAMFRQIKEGLTKPHLSGMENVLDKSAPGGGKRSDLPKGPPQVGHNQTFGADVNRAGVPRRTPG
jgi:hypothetical protein